MKLNITVDGESDTYRIPDNLIVEARDFFDKLDADMDKGWQMSRDWVDNPTPDQRCQIAADKILGAMETDNQKLLMLMMAYILYKKPGIQGVHIATNGDMTQTVLVMEPDQEPDKPMGPIFG